MASSSSFFFLTCVPRLGRRQGMDLLLNMHAGSKKKGGAVTDKAYLYIYSVFGFWQLCRQTEKQKTKPLCCCAATWAYENMIERREIALELRMLWQEGHATIASNRFVAGIADLKQLRKYRIATFILSSKVTAVLGNPIDWTSSIYFLFSARKWLARFFIIAAPSFLWN